MTQVSHRAACDAIDDYYTPDDPPAPRRSFVPVRRGERSLASFNGSQRETVSTEQLQLPFPAKTNPSWQLSDSGEPSEQVDTGWTLIQPKENAEVADSPQRRSAGSTKSIATDGVQGAASSSEKAPAPVIRAPRTASVADITPSDTTFSIQRFLMGCAAGFATAAMILITIRFAVG